jgi:transcriptional regulator with XRE-family HTH domain
VRDWIAVLAAATGKVLWRKFTIPAPGEPGSETWTGANNAWQTGGAALRVTGTYDPETDQTIWETGNPAPMFDPTYRLYTMNRHNGQIIGAKPYMDNVNCTKGIDQRTGDPLDYDPARDIHTYAGIGNLTPNAPLKKEELADRAGPSARYLGSIERGAVSASVTLLGRLAQALRIDACELLIRLPPRRRPARSDR